MSSSKYPQVIFFRHNNYSEIDVFIEENNRKLACSVFITNSIDDLQKLSNPNYHILVTYGNTYQEYDYISTILPSRFSSRWFHKTNISNLDEFNHNVNYCYIDNVIRTREDTRPIFSIFTTCFKSYEYIDTAYKSIKKQRLNDWEWVIMDDTPEDKHFDFLRQKLSHDNRVRLYKRDKNSGNIGNVKNEVISLCRGKYVLEMDHDDEILENCLLDAYNIFQTDDEIGFVYGDTIHLYRNNDNYKYNDFICKGYGGYYMENVNGKWAYVYTTPNINNITLSHLVCLPNHPRIWKRSALMECENYSEFLPICDDYEILLRTCCSKYKVAKNNKAQYIQYMNDDGNNFSNIRNAEINRIGPNYISPMFYNKYEVHKVMKVLDAHEDEKYITQHSPIWKRGPDYQHKKMNLRVNLDYDNQYCIINDAINNDELVELYKNSRNDFLFLSNTMTHEQLQDQLERKGFSRMKCYSYMDCSEEELITFFKHIYLNDNCEYEIIQNRFEERNSTTKRLSNIQDIQDCQRIFIIHNNRNGGADKYITDIITMYPNNDYIYITDLSVLNKYSYTDSDLLVIQNLLNTDIQIQDIINIHNKYNFKIIIPIHDFVWLCDDIHNYSNHIPSAYLNEHVNISTDIKNIFSIAEKVIMNSRFTYDIYSKYFDSSNFVLSYPNDYKIQREIMNVPEIKDGCINIGIFSPLSKFKGERYVNYLRNKYESEHLRFHIVGQNIPPYKETEFFEHIRKYNINGFLLLNEWGETYCYLLTKIINSGLPLLYNNFGAIKERIDSNREHYFKVFDDESDYDKMIYNNNSNEISYNMLDVQFNNFTEYIHIPSGESAHMNEDYTIMPTKIYDELFRNNNYKLEPSINDSHKQNNTILIYTGFMDKLWNYSYLQNNPLGGSEKAIAYLSKEFPSNYQIIVCGDVMDEIIGNVQYTNASNLTMLLNTQSFHTIIVSRFVSFFTDYPYFSCGQLYVCSHDSIGFINRVWNSSENEITNIHNILLKYDKYITGVVALTDWHKIHLSTVYPSIQNKIHIINNGIDTTVFPVINNKITNKLVWTSCSNRGLSVLLNLWSSILTVMPDATLDICSYHTFPSSIDDVEMNNIILQHNSITHHGRLNTSELYKLMSISEYWLYTNTVPESSCITALEMLMNKVICLYYPLGGLNDTIGKYGITVNPGSEVEAIIHLTTEKKELLKKTGREYAISCSWETRAKEWTNMLGLCVNTTCAYDGPYTVDNYHNTRSINFFTYPRDKCIISNETSLNRIWESHMHQIFEKYITKQCVVLEGGCHIGTHTVKLALLGMRVLAFEPLIESNNILRKNIKLNNLHNITVYNDGLSNKPDVAFFQWIGHNNPGASGLSNNPMGTPSYSKKTDKQIPVNLITIDSLCLDNLNFIKLDVEGYEINVIEGGINTIKKYKPIITLEVYENFNGKFSIEHTKTTFKILLDIGYTVHHIAGPDFLFLPTM